MPGSNTPSREWNIFARELSAVLEEQGLRLGHLNDRADIHPERVRRLQRSLVVPRFNVLPPEDLDRVIEIFKFDEEQQIRLRAAILATAIEEMLMGRIDADDALEAANAILPILQRALRDHGSGGRGIGTIREEPDDYRADNDLDELLDDALSHLDSAILALHMVREGNDANRAEALQRAGERVRAAIVRLESLPESVRESAAWLIWHAEALKGLASVERLQAEDSTG